MGEHEQLDRLLSALRAQRADARLTALEPLVWDRIAARAAPAVWVGQRRWQGAAVALAMSFGVAVGGVAAAGPVETEMAVFSAHAAFAPSTILGGGR